MPTCFVPGCQSGYLKNRKENQNKKTTLFRAPTDPDRLEKWRRAVPRADKVLTSECRICERHFSEEFIDRKYVISLPDGVVEIEREHPRLKSDAIPHIFPNLPHYLSSKPNKRKKNKLQELKEHGHIAAAPSHQNISESVLHNHSPEILEEMVDDNDTMSFDELCAISSSICPTSWIAHYNTELLCFGKVNFINKGLEISTSVCLDRELGLTILHYGYPTGFEACGYVCSKLYLTDLLLRIDKALTCTGINIQSVNSYKCKVGFIDNGVYRSRSCLRVNYKKGPCASCKKLKKLLQDNKRRRALAIKCKRRLTTKQALQKSSNYYRIKYLKSKTVINSNFLESRFLTTLPENQQLAIQQCLKQSKCRSNHGMRYNKKWILNSLLLRINSPKAYNHLIKNKILTMPSRSTLQRYIDSVKTDIGICEQALEAISKRIVTDTDRHGMLIFDEVKLREGIQFSLKKCQYEGLVDLGEFGENSGTCADTGLVFMYRPIMGEWVQAVAVYLNKGPTKSNVLTKMLLHIIVALESHGLWVSGVVCDESTLNRGVWKEFGISGLKENTCNSTLNPAAFATGKLARRKLFFFSDYVHLFKCIRNNLLNKRILTFPEGAVKLSHFESLLKLGTQHSGLRAVPKLTSNHVQPNSLQRMNVRLAVQLFSNSVADGFEFYKQKGCPEMKDVDVTIAFIRRLNRLFDVLNSKIPRMGLKSASNNMMFLRECSEWLDSWEVFVKKSGSSGFLSPSTCAGLRVTLKSTIELSELLLQSGFSYVLTSRFSQDPLELLLGQIRNAAGCEDHPTAAMFMQLFKLLSLYSLARPLRKTGESALNLLPSTSAPSKRQSKVLEVSECLGSLSAIVDDFDDIDESFQLSSNLSESQCSDTKKNIIYYVSGYVLRHCRNVLDCHFCKNYLTSPTDNHESADLTNIKLRGRLLFPSTVLFEALTAVEDVVVKHLSDKNLFSLFERIVSDSVQYLLPVRSGLCIEHHWLAGEILVYYITTRLHWQSKIINQEAVSARMSKQNRKKAKLC